MKVKVITHPNSKISKAEKDLTGNLHVYVNEAPEKGKANNAVMVAVARFFKVKTNRIFLVKGMKSRKKVFEVLNNS